MTQSNAEALRAFANRLDEADTWPHDPDDPIIDEIALQVCEDKDVVHAEPKPNWWANYVANQVRTLIAQGRADRVRHLADLYDDALIRVIEAQAICDAADSLLRAHTGPGEVDIDDEDDDSAIGRHVRYLIRVAGRVERMKRNG